MCSLKCLCYLFTGIQSFQDLSRWWRFVDFNPLSPSIHIKILRTDLHTFPLRISWENLIKHQGIFSFVIIFYILTTLSLDNVWILLGENCCWSLLGLKGLSNVTGSFTLPSSWCERMKEIRPTAQLCHHPMMLSSEPKMSLNYSEFDLTSFFKTLVGVLINSLALNRLALSQYVWGLCYQGSTVLAKSNVRNLSSLDNRQGSHGADPSKVKVSSALCWGFPEKRRQVSGQEWDQL